MKFTPYIATLLLALSCASKSIYQPTPVAAAYRDRPMSHLTPEEVQELELLHQKNDLTVLQKRRLWELTGYEIRSLKPNTPRYKEKTEFQSNLALQLGEVDAELKAIKEQNSAWKDPSATPEEKPSASFRSAKLRREYTQVLSIWNKDRLEEAMRKITKTLGDDKLMGDATDEEWTKLLTLQFRLAVELDQTPVAVTAYETMRSHGKCTAETAQAAFLLSIHWLVKNEGAKGLQVLDDQCDPDKSPYNRIKTMYWKGRLRASTGMPRNQAFKELLTTPVPGYYLYLAKSWMKEKLEFPLGAFGQPSVLRTSLQLPSKVVEYIERAKERLNANLKKEASVYLLRASQLLREKLTRESLDGLLYVAHLMQAAAQPLEAMRLYAVVSQELQEDAPENKTIPLDFLGEMFPKPFSTEIELKCQEWGLDPDYVFALMRQESAFNAGALSSADARGVLQILPSVAREIARQKRYPYFQDKSLFYVNENLKMALTHLVTLKAKVDHPFFIAASYNAGFERFSRWRRRYGNYPLDAFVELIPVNETKNYIKLVTRNLLHYRAQRNGGWVEPDLFPLEGFHAGPVAGFSSPAWSKSR